MLQTCFWTKRDSRKAGSLRGMMTGVTGVKEVNTPAVIGFTNPSARAGYDTAGQFLSGV